MKNYIILLLLTVFLVTACSSDKDEDTTLDSNSLLGSWEFTELDLNGLDADGEIKLASELLKVLVAQGCDILTFTFKEDQTVDAVSRDFTETGTDVNPDGNGLLIECPENVETTSSTWSLEGDQLTFADESGMNETVTIELNGNTLVIPAEIVDEDNLDGAKAIFKKK